MRTIWKRLSVTAAGLIIFSLATHVVMPGIDFQAFLRFFRTESVNPLLWLYDRLSGGGALRASIVALGFMPYVTARIWMQIARLTVSRVRALHDSVDGQATLSRWTRGLTISFALVQSYGFAHMLQGVPGVVGDPGVGFVSRVVVTLTGGAIVAMLLSEQVQELAVASIGAAEPDGGTGSAPTGGPPAQGAFGAGYRHVEVPDRPQPDREQA